MKSHLLQLRQSPLRLAILTGFVGLEAIDLAETIALHHVDPAALAKIHTVTSFFSLAIVAVCVFLISAPEAERSVTTGAEPARRDVDPGRAGPPRTSEAKECPIESPMEISDVVLEEQVLSLP